MRRIVLASVAVLALAACKKQPPLFERIFALDEIPRFEITLSAKARASLAAHPRKWVHGGFAYGDERFDDVGIRLKGHRSLRALDAKPSFKIKLDKFGHHELAGRKTIILNNMVEDPSMMREVLAYRLYRALGVAAPNAGFAEVVIDGEPAGLYAVIEAIDKKFLRQRFDDPGGPLFEGEYGCDVIPDDVEGFDHDRGPDDRDGLAALARVAAGDAALVFGPGSPLDVPAFLRFLAVEIYVGNFDGYRHGHNYRLYLDPGRGTWSLLPWGLDRTFVKNMTLHDSNGYLARRCFADATCSAAYARTMRDVIAEARRLRLEQGVDVIGVVTAEAAARDPHHAGDLRKARAALRSYLVDRPAELEGALGCLDPAGAEVDADHDGYGCLDCDDHDPARHPGAPEACDRIDNDCDGVIDDAACNCAPLVVGDARLALCAAALPYADAAKLCAARGETLARIDDADQLRQVTAAAREVRAAGADRHAFERWWIGLDDRAAEGAFRGPGGGPPAFTAWGRGEPDNAGCNQDCAVIDLDQGTWRDTHCLEPHPFVCRAR